MEILRNGERGPKVSDLQKALNALQSKLPRLVVDGVFGRNTFNRVCEFQRLNGLAADGVVGPLTRTRLEQLVVNPEFLQQFMFALIDKIAIDLAARDRVVFVGQSRVLVRNHTGNDIEIGGGAKSNQSVGNVGVLIGGAAFLLLLIFMLMMLIMMENSKNAKTRQRAVYWRGRYGWMQSKAGEADALATAYEENKRMATEIHDTTLENHKKCLDLYKGLDPKSECMKALEKLKKAIDSLFDTLRKNPAPGDGFKAEDLVKGMGRAIATLQKALNDAADNCPNCHFLRL